MKELVKFFTQKIKTTVQSEVKEFVGFDWERRRRLEPSDLTRGILFLSKASFKGRQ